MGSKFAYSRLPELPAGPINFNTSGDNIVIPISASNRIGIHRIWLKVAGATVLTFKDGIGNALSGPVSLQAFDEIKFDLSGEPWMTCAPNSAFLINSSQAVQVGGIIYYYASFAVAPIHGFVLMEDGSYMLQEDGSKIVLES